MRALAAGDFEVREAVVLTIRASQVLPDYTAPDLTLYDVLEETFPDITSRLEMLERSGLLRTGPAPPPPDVEPPPVGRWTVGAASIEQGDEGPIVVRIGELCVELVQSFGEYEVRTYRDAMQVNHTGMHPTFGEAVEAAADALRARPATRLSPR